MMAITLRASCWPNRHEAFGTQTRMAVENHNIQTRGSRLAISRNRKAGCHQYVCNAELRRSWGTDSSRPHPLSLQLWLNRRTGPPGLKTRRIRYANVLDRTWTSILAVSQSGSAVLRPLLHTSGDLRVPNGQHHDGVRRSREPTQCEWRYLCYSARDDSKTFVTVVLILASTFLATLCPNFRGEAEVARDVIFEALRLAPSINEVRNKEMHQKGGAAEFDTS